MSQRQTVFSSQRQFLILFISCQIALLSDIFGHVTILNDWEVIKIEARNETESHVKCISYREVRITVQTMSQSGQCAPPR